MSLLPRACLASFNAILLDEARVTGELPPLDDLAAVEREINEFDAATQRAAANNASD